MLSISGLPMLRLRSIIRSNRFCKATVRLKIRLWQYSTCRLKGLTPTPYITLIFRRLERGAVTRNHAKLARRGHFVDTLSEPC